MDKGKVHPVNGIINEDEDKLQFFAGDIFEDKHAEEVFPTDAELDEIFNIVVNDF